MALKKLRRMYDMTAMIVAVMGAPLSSHRRLHIDKAMGSGGILPVPPETGASKPEEIALLRCRATGVLEESAGEDIMAGRAISAAGV